MIVLSFPFNKNFDSLYNQHKGEDFYKEFRLDYSKKLSLFPKNILDEKSIVTIRNKKYGGIYDTPTQIKYKYFEKIIAETSSLIDIEFENIDFYKNLVSKRTIISYHNFGDFDQTAIIDFIKKTEKLDLFCLKIAVQIDNYIDLDFLFNLKKTTSQKLIIVGMGKLGKISRLLFPFYSIGTYVGISENQTANGQIFLNDVKTFNLKKINNKFCVGGLIGGNQVYHSLGLEFYNHYFKTQNLHAIYLPFEVDNFSDFSNFINKNFPSQCYGFSVTMPHKITAAQNSYLEVVNLITNTGVFNTDVIAMKKSLEYLKISQQDRILIIGTGAMAKITFNLLKNYTNIYVTGKNIQEKEIPMTFRKITLTKINKIQFDCIINCTPIGLQGENFIEYFNLKYPTKIIDLPYSKKDNVLSNNYISGKQFWKWQSEKQLDIFKKNIIENCNY
jgi:3-dehydroquinate dehydratase type I